MKTFIATGHTLPTHDYRPALQGALSWLGNRYLLAEPLNRRRDDSRAEFNGSRGAQQPASPAGAIG